MAYTVESLKSGLDHCLQHLKKLEKFEIDGDRVTYKGKKVRVESNEENNAKQAEIQLHDFVRENQTMIEAVHGLNHALENFGSRNSEAYGTGMGQGNTTPDGASSASLNGAPAQISASSLSSVNLKMPQDENTPGLRELKSTRMNFQQKLPGQAMENYQEQAQMPKLESATITQFPTSTSRSMDPAMLKAQISQMKAEIEGLKAKQENDTRQVLIQEFLESMKKRSPTMKEDEALKKLVNRNAELIDRLAAEMNARIAADEKSLENIGIQNRPTKVAEQYSILMSNEWLAAKEVLDERSPEDKYEKRKNLFLNGVLEIAERKATKYFCVLDEKLALQLQNPLDDGAAKKHNKLENERGAKPKQRTPSPWENDGGTSKQHLPSYILSSVSDYLRQSADYVNLEPLIQAVHKSVLNRYAENKQETWAVMNQPDFSTYIKQSARLAWKMVLQKPPLEFKTDRVGEEWTGGGDLDLALSSDPRKKGAVVRYYKHPSLIQGEKLLVKGVAVVN